MATMVARTPFNVISTLSLLLYVVIKLIAPCGELALEEATDLS
jgi:hypothetical protein